MNQLKPFLKNLLIGITLVLLISSCSDEEKQDKTTIPPVGKVDTNQVLYFGGDIVTMEGAAGEQIEAVITDHKNIIFAGTKSQAVAAYPNASLFDLKNNTLFPGLIEQHIHPVLGALTLSIPVIAPEAWVLPNKTWPAVTSHKGYLSALADLESDLTNPNEILWSWGYHQLSHGDLNRGMLDRISTERPIVVWHRSCHEFFLNSKAIELFGIHQTDIDSKGTVIAAQINLKEGHFYEAGAIIYLVPLIMPELAKPLRFAFGLKQMVNMLHKNGVTAFNEPGAIIFPGSEALYQLILGAESTPMYSYFIPSSQVPFREVGKEGLQAAVEKQLSIFPEKGKIRFFKKQVKILFDGAIVSQLMMMKDGYLDGHQGEWIQPPTETEQIFETFWKADYQIHIHVNGDLGLEKLIAIIEKNMQQYPRKDHRTTIVHFANSTEEQIKKLAELGCIVSANPYYVTGFSDKYAEVGLGAKRANAMVRLGSVEKLNIPISLHSDLPIAPANPLYLAWMATTRETLDGNHPRMDLALSKHTALRAITIDAAQSWRMEDKIGSIKIGKIANFTIMKQNPYKIENQQLKDIEIVATVFEGNLFPVE